MIEYQHYENPPLEYVQAEDLVCEDDGFRTKGKYNMIKMISATISNEKM